jgi:ParB family chromosome partitioning protein
MSAAKKGLGRGFESLIPTDLIDDSFNPNSAYDPTAQQDELVSQEKTLPIHKIVANPNQPRRVFDEDAITELSESIQEHGIIQPILVTPKGDNYEIVAGERRYRASKLAGLTEVPVIIRSMSDQHQLEISLIENIQRRDLNSIETATAYAKLRDQFNLTNDQIAKRVNKSVSAVVNKMRLLKLPKEVVALIAEGQISEGQARLTSFVDQRADKAWVKVHLSQPPSTL